MVFSGIVEEIGRVERMGQSERGLTMVISCRSVLEGTRLGDSISVDDVCMTVSSMMSTSFTAEIQPITARLSTGRYALRH